MATILFKCKPTHVKHVGRRGVREEGDVSGDMGVPWVPFWAAGANANPAHARRLDARSGPHSHQPLLLRAAAVFMNSFEELDEPVMTRDSTEEEALE